MPSRQQTYLDFGGALAAFGLIFAVAQLRKDSWRIVQTIRGNWEADLYFVLAGCGLIFTLIGILFAAIPEITTVGFLTMPLTYNVIAYAFFIASPIYLLYSATSVRGLFTEKRARNFYVALLEAVSRESERSLDHVLTVLMPNFASICAAARQHVQDDTRTYARAILDVILSDQAFVRVLATRRLDALTHTFVSFEHYNIDEHCANTAVPRILRCLYIDDNSYLYKHLNYQGLALSSDLYATIFESSTLLENFDLFGNEALDYISRERLNKQGLNVYITALTRAVAIYLVKGDVSPRRINVGISQISEIFKSYCYQLRKLETSGPDGPEASELWDCVRTITHFLGHDFRFIADGKVRAAIECVEATPIDPDYHSNETINAAVGAAIYEAFESISMLDSSFHTYQAVIDLLHHLLQTSSKPLGYQRPFENRLWEQIAFNVGRRMYPVPLKPFLDFVGLGLLNSNRKSGTWFGDQVERIRRLLYVDLKPLFEGHAKMINDKSMQAALLPGTVTYVNGAFFYKDGNGKRHSIAAPAADSKSALEGLDLEKMPTPL